MQIKVDAPAGMDKLDIAQAIVGSEYLLKAERIKTGEHTWHRYRPMHEAHDQEVNAYLTMLHSMLDRIQQYVERYVTHGPLTKSAQQPLIFITSEQADKLREIIGDFHEAFIAGALNPNLLKRGELQRLIDANIVSQDLKYILQPRDEKDEPPQARRSILEAYQYGVDIGREPTLQARSGLKNTSYDRWNARVKRPLAPAEAEAVKWAEKHAAQYVRGLGNRIADQFGTIVVDQQLRAEHEELIRDAVAMNVWRRESWRETIMTVRDQTRDYARDYGRIAATEKQRAMQEGLSRTLVKQHGKPKNIRVAKQPAPDACEHCVRLHLTAGRGSPPRIFTMDQLRNNGTNVGRKARDWRAVVGPVHPWCACELIHVPDGWIFDDEGNLIPEQLKRSELVERNLLKAQTLNYTESVPSDMVVVRVGDPTLRAAIEAVVAETPREVFTDGSGVTLITTETNRPNTPLRENDYAYWTANEIRVMQTIPHHKIDRVIRHEIGHSLNVWVLKKLGTVDAVKQWHTSLDKISRKEGYVSAYAKREPIENAAEATRWYLYDRKRLMIRFPRTFAFLHRMYRDLIRGTKHARSDNPEAARAT